MSRDWESNFKLMAFRQLGMDSIQEEGCIDFIRRIAAQERQAGREEALQHLKHCHLKGRKSYSTDSWDAGYHDALFDAERAILTARSPKDGDQHTAPC
jgi:hypothetical protein